MNFSKNKQRILLSLILLTTLILIPPSFAQDNDLNDTINEIDTNQNNNLQDLDNNHKTIINSEVNTNNIKIEESESAHNINKDKLSSNQNLENKNKTINTKNNNPLKESNKINLFLISDNPGTNILDKASNELFNEYDLTNVNIIIRSGDQIKTMPEEDVKNLLDSCDGFIGEWISSDVDAVLTSIINKNQYLSNKKIFLILEPPSGNLNSESSSINLIKNNTLNYNKIFTEYANDDLINYFKNTKRGLNYNNVYDYITNGDGKNFDGFLNNLILYKNINNKDNLKNQILYILNYLGLDFDFKSPTFTGTKLYGIYRDRWYSLDEYKSTFFNPNNTRTIGILESTMYIESQQLHTCYSIIEYLESRGYNVIPVFAAGGSAEQLKVMLESWTNAGSDLSGFLEDKTKYDIYVDGIISMVAYGVGGSNFANTTKFFEEMGVPVFRAIHSDYVSNEEWELSSTGLTTQKSDKWWHITIAETQGIIDATFIGGASTYISNLTGAQIKTYIPHKENIELLCDRINSWVNLKYLNNNDKQISI